MDGRNFTWFRGIKYQSAAKLDRFFYLMDWEEVFKNINHKILPRVTFDHSPIMFEYGNWEHKISYFKFENWWLNVEGFNDMV